MKLSTDVKAVLVTIAFFLVLALGVYAVKKESSLEIVTLIADCYDKQMQCGIHIIIEDSEYEDPSLELVEEWLIENVHDVPIADKTTGLRIVRHLMKLTYQERAELLNRAFDLYTRRRMP